MTSISTTTPCITAAESAATHAQPQVKIKRRLGRYGRRAATAVATVALGAGITLAGASSASAATGAASAGTSYQCNATATGGTVSANPLNMPFDSRTTTYYVYVEQWQGGTAWRGYWVLSSQGRSSYTMQDSGYNQRNQARFDFTVSHGYYRLWFDVMSTGDSSYNWVQAPLLGGSSSSYWGDAYICRL